MPKDNIERAIKMPATKILKTTRKLFLRDIQLEESQSF